MLLAASLLGAAGIQYAINGFSTLACLWQFPLLTAGMLAGLVLLFLLVLFVSTLFVDPKKMVEKPSAYFRFMLNQFCRLALFLGGVRVHVTGLEQVPRKSRFMLISNHAFAFDPLIYYYAMPWADLVFLAKKESFSIFVVAQIMREVLCLRSTAKTTVRRSRPSSRPSSLSKRINAPLPSSPRAAQTAPRRICSPSATARLRSHRRRRCRL